MARAKEIALDLRAQLEQLLDLLERQTRDDRAAMRIERHEPFGLELTQRLAHGNAAHAELVGERVLPQRLAFGIVAAQDALAQRFDRHAGDRLPLDGHGRR